MDDKACMDMCQAITNGGPADIFVERVVVDHAEQSANLEKLSAYFSSPEKIEKEVAQYSKYIDWIRDSDDGNEVVKAKKSLMQEVSVNGSAPVEEGYNSDSDDSDQSYLPGDDESSEDDEEAGQIRADLKELKKKLSDRGMVVVDDEGHEVNVENLMPSNPFAEGVGVESDSTEVDTDEDADSYDEEEGEVIRKKREFPRFDGSADVPTFSLGMSFPDKATFREAIIKYGLAVRKVLKFVKNEAARCRVVCTWPKCPFVLLLSKTSRAESSQLATCIDNHTCPPRRDNSLVTSKKIADKYERMIKANPQWSIQSIRETVQEEMFADVSVSKIKRAKSIVMLRMYDATKGEYAMVFDYQLELLRSNPGSTVVVKLDTEEAEPTFMRFYVCFDACKKGFLAGCRKVIGFDGCFFKGLTNGELLCALGRDANNQMYLIAWAVVERD